MGLQPVGEVSEFVREMDLYGCSLEDRRGAGDGENVAIVIDDCTRKPRTRSSAQTYFLFWNHFVDACDKHAAGHFTYIPSPS